MGLGCWERAHFFSTYMRWEKAPLVWGKRAFAPLFLFAEGFSTYYLYASAAGARFDKKSGTHTFCPPFFLAQFVKRVEKGGKETHTKKLRKKTLVSAFEKPTVLPQRKRKKTNLPEKRGAKAKASSSLPPIHFPIISPPRKDTIWPLVTLAISPSSPNGPPITYFSFRVWFSYVHLS